MELISSNSVLIDPSKVVEEAIWTAKFAGGLQQGQILGGKSKGRRRTDGYLVNLTESVHLMCYLGIHVWLGPMTFW